MAIIVLRRRNFDRWPVEDALATDGRVEQSNWIVGGNWPFILDGCDLV
jgi:hypothetical protein